MESKIKYFVFTVCVILSYSIAAEQSPDPRCFRFTWLGPRWTNTSDFANATCDGLTELASGVPCFRPLVVTYDGSWPDIDEIWRQHGENVSCELARNDVCAQYTYYFDGHVENSTYMCTRGISADGVAIKSGCYEEKNGSFAKRVCLCRSTPGIKPCNNSVIILANVYLIVILIIMLFDQHVMGRTWFY